MQITMKYGKTGLDINFPDDWSILWIEKKDMPLLENPQQSLQQALSNPVAAPPLAESAQNASTVCILICDITRPVPNGTILPVLLRCLIENGIQPDAITILVATGLHRPNKGAELAELVGDPWVLDTVKVENHFARNDEDHIDLGKTADGLPIRLDRRFVEADLKIVTGLVEPHFMAGFSGGRKVIMPGIAHQDAIRRFHTAHYLENPKAANCVLEGNPLHEIQLEIVQKLPKTMAINSVIDEQRRIAFMNYGDIEKSHLEAVKFLRPFVEIPIAQKFATIITSGGGYPLDKNYYQTVKGMVGAMNILKPGGNLVIVSECSEGMGSKEYIQAQKQLQQMGTEKFLECLNSRQVAEIDEWETEMQIKPMRLGSIHLYSKMLSDSLQSITGVRQVTSLSETLQSCVRLQNDRQVAVIPDGPYTIPIYTAEALTNPETI
jgi:nickel-dependent lactate racemase